MRLMREEILEAALAARLLAMHGQGRPLSDAEQSGHFRLAFDFIHLQREPKGEKSRFCLHANSASYRAIYAE